MKHFGVDVAGGDHAGAEAALAPYRRGAGVTLVKHRFDRIGGLACNPAVGGWRGHCSRDRRS